MKTAAVVGAESMLGREIVSQLEACHVVVLAFGRSTSPLRFDLTAPELDGVVGMQADVLFHCAAAFGRDDTEGARINSRVNAEGALAVVSLAERLGCRHVIYAGSVSSIVGYESTGKPNSYGISKAHAEQWIDWAMARVEGRFCSLRYSQLFDTEGRCCRHQPWFGRIVGYASRGLDLRLPTSEGPRNYLHIEDAARLTLRAADLGLTGIWPMCHPESLDHTQIAELAYAQFPGPGRLIHDPSKAPFRAVATPDSRALFERLDDQPRVDLRTGLSRIHAAGTSDRFGPLDVR